MAEYRKGAHTVYDLKYHLVWVMKYRYEILEGEIAKRARDIIREGRQWGQIFHRDKFVTMKDLIII